MSRLKRFAPVILLAGDMIALALFVYIGQRDHELVNPDQPLLGVLLTAAEFAVPWVVAGGCWAHIPAVINGRAGRCWPVR